MSELIKPRSTSQILKENKENRASSPNSGSPLDLSDLKLNIDLEEGEGSLPVEEPTTTEQPSSPEYAKTTYKAQSYELTKLAPNKFNTRFGDARLPTAAVVENGPRVDDNYDPEAYDNLVDIYYREHETEIIERMSSASRLTPDLEALKEEHKKIGALAFSILNRGQDTPGEVFFQQALQQFVITKGHRRTLACHVLKKQRDFLAVTIDPSQASLVYQHLAGVIGNSEHSPSARDQLFSMLMAMKAFEETSRPKEVPNNRFVMANAPNYSANQAKVISAMFSNAQKDASGYIWELIGKRFFTSADHYQRMVSGCGRDVNAIVETLKMFENPNKDNGNEGQKKKKSIAKVTRSNQARWKTFVKALASEKGIAKLKEVAEHADELKPDELQLFIDQLLEGTDE